jgi:NADPH:quinone reductase-like Zn-dependent oxidoreductase
MVVGQLAKAWGCRAVGIAGGKEKCDYVRSLGFDACVDYKTGNLYDDLKEACPKGVDVYFENVGGQILDTLLRLMNMKSRIIVCGLISDYNALEPYGVEICSARSSSRTHLGKTNRSTGGALSERARPCSELWCRRETEIPSRCSKESDRAKGLIGFAGGKSFGKQLL